MNATITPTQDLDRLLSEPVSAAMQREGSAFDEALQSVPRRAVVIYAAGNLGRMVQRILAQANIDVLAFTDANPAKWGTSVDDVSVYSPDSAIAMFGSDALFIVSMWHPTKSDGVAAITRSLEARGCRKTIPFVSLFWKYASISLPYYLWDLPSKLLSQKERVQAGYEALSEDLASQTEYVRQVKLRLTGDFTCLGDPPNEAPYFASDLFRPIADEVFVDCGAFDGDTVAEFLKWTSGSFSRLIAFEADPSNAEALRRYAQNEPALANRAKVIDQAVSDKVGVVRFQASGDTSAAVSATGDIEVACTTLDDTIAGDHVTFIKMDIEGAELAALTGAQTTIQRSQPILTICAYHQQDHLWEIPLFLSQALKNPYVALRSYYRDGFETIVFAVPAERSLKLLAF